jgi:hypothetical protein
MRDIFKFQTSIATVFFLIHIKSYLIWEPCSTEHHLSYEYGFNVQKLGKYYDVQCSYKSKS